MNMPISFNNVVTLNRADLGLPEQKSSSTETPYEFTPETIKILQSKPFENLTEEEQTIIAKALNVSSFKDVTKETFENIAGIAIIDKDGDGEISDKEIEAGKKEGVELAKKASLSEEEKYRANLGSVALGAITKAQEESKSQGDKIDPTGNAKAS
jgi:hypothetical protein